MDATVEIMMQLINYHTMLMLVPMVSNDQKCHVDPHFDCLDLTHAKVPLLCKAVLASA